MSWSLFTIGLQFHMLDGRKECVPGFEDSSGGHLMFTSGQAKLRSRQANNSSNIESPEFDIEAASRAVVEDIKQELDYDRERGDAKLMSLVRLCLVKAKQHCCEVHVKNDEVNT